MLETNRAPKFARFSDNFRLYIGADLDARSRYSYGNRPPPRGFSLGESQTATESNRAVPQQDRLSSVASCQGKKACRENAEVFDPRRYLETPAAGKVLAYSADIRIKRLLPCDWRLAFNHRLRLAPSITRIPALNRHIKIGEKFPSITRSFSPA